MALQRTSVLFLLASAAVCGTVSGQATATATASQPYSQFTLPDVGGELRYALTASESLLSGYNGNAGSGVNSYTNLGGDVAYLSKNPNHQFSGVYAGGYLFGTSSFPSYFYQTLTLSQGYRTKNWNFLIGDTVSYLPQTPIGSLSGVPGTGDTGLPVVTVGQTPTLGILTTYTTRVDNLASATISRTLTAKTSLSVTGTDGLERYIGSSTQGIDNDQQGGYATLQHRFSERTTLGGQYAFTNSTFNATPYLGRGDFGFQTHSALVLLTRQFTPDLALTASIGPQIVTSSTGRALVSSTSVDVAANAALTYQARNYSASLNYTRGVNNGNGVVLGSRMDSVVANLSRPFGRIYNAGVLAGWNHSAQLQNSTLGNFSNQAVVGGGQLSAQVHHDVSVFVAYTLQRQSYSGYQATGIAFDGLTQYGTIGITYSPKPLFRK